ncbi:MAG: hypothetical protein NC293_07725 [Roseburia sp.]|nr:hypothetical protein [Roseburia sp.]
MNNNCEFCGGGYCLCDACRSMQKAIKEAEAVSKEEVDRIFRDAETLIEDIKASEEGGKACKK